MFIDASAAIAIMAGEQDGPALFRKLQSVAGAYVSPLAHYEMVTGLARAQDMSVADATAYVERFERECSLRMLAIDDSIAKKALAAFARYGKGRHKAKLNIGDCFAYACAKTLDVPLLCKGNDFKHTDAKLA